ncbi:hypothetical protein Solca_4022 [Solitalea canadensis DSM 3403]|uniref:Uncharacterized protein n=1 Tax=Solitalea canadensis (strain ATCC 29591 / DSM 3403 / JCM 21819 / LMG 8368 / NBRC 15130 / NCIMB 12057 / USAM 9D) TaxID=929556 RepID=H8KMM2_SOLCM|nr:hypothetical protein Solca_4022 [Solitalea canadensis DSM 3403]
MTIHMSTVLSNEDQVGYFEQTIGGEQKKVSSINGVFKVQRDW